jgi:hypothetical protein
VHPLQTINEAGIDANNNALVLEISPQHVKPIHKEDIESAEIQKPEADNDIASSKLEELVRVATMAHKALVEVSQTLQHHAGESAIAFIETRLQNLENVVLEEVQRSIREAVLERSCTQVNVDHNANLSLDTPWKEGETTPAHLNKFNIGDIDSDDGDKEIDKDRQVIQSNGDTISITRSIDDDVEQQSNKSKADLWVNTKPTDIEPPHSFGLSTELDVTQDDNPTSEIKEEADDADGKVLLQLPHACTLQQESNNEVVHSVVDETSTAVDSPSQGRAPTIVKHETDDTGLSSELVSVPPPRSLQKIHVGTEDFRFSEYESEDCISVDVTNQTHDSNNDLSEIYGFAPAVDIASVATDSDMQSIEVSMSEFRAVVDPPPRADTSKDADTMNCFGRKRLNKKGFFFKKMASKWMNKKSRAEKNFTGETGKLYAV